MPNPLPAVQTISIDKRVKDAIAIIESEFAKPLREKDVARRVGMSVSRFRSLFKKATGRTFRRYLLEYRVAKADEMIWQNPALRTSEVAYAVGYGHVSSLDRARNKCCGRPPRWVKRSAIGESAN